MFLELITDLKVALRTCPRYRCKLAPEMIHSVSTVEERLEPYLEMDQANGAFALWSVSFSISFARATVAVSIDVHASLALAVGQI